MKRHLFLILLLSVPLLAAPVEGEQCPLTRPQLLPTASQSGAWTGSVLNLVDTFNDSILRYTRHGQFLGEVRLDRVPGLAPFAPSAMIETSSGLLLQMQGGRFANLNQSFNPTRLRDAFQESSDAEESVDGLFNWQVTANEDLVFCGDVRQGENHRSGFLRAPLDALEDFHFIEERGVQDPHLIYCRLGYPLIATLSSGDSYFLFTGRGSDDPQGSEVWLYRLPPRDEHAQDVTAQRIGEPLGRWPTLPYFATSEDFAKIMNIVESNEMPVALFSWKDALFLLYRMPEERGETRWEIRQLDGKSGTVLGTARLPSKANHLTIVAGFHLAVLEKGPVRGIEKQESLGIRFIPDAALDKVGSPEGGLLCTD